MVRLEERDPCSAKEPKTIDAPFGLTGLGGRSYWMKAGQLAGLKQDPPVDKSIRLSGRTAGFGKSVKRERLFARKLEILENKWLY